MNARLLLPLLLFAHLFSVRAQEAQAEFNFLAPLQATEEWKPTPELWKDVLSEKRDYPTVSVGRTEFQVSGPLTETFRRPQEWSDLSLGQKILSLPVINLVVPLRMPHPPGGGGSYFAWGESSVPWTAIADGAAPGTVRGGAAYHESRSGLFSFGW